MNNQPTHRINVSCQSYCSLILLLHTLLGNVVQNLDGDGTLVATELIHKYFGIEKQSATRMKEVHARP